MLRCFNKFHFNCARDINSKHRGIINCMKGLMNYAGQANEYFEKINEEYKNAQRLIPLNENETLKIRNLLIKITNEKGLLNKIAQLYSIPLFFLMDNDVRNNFLKCLSEDTTHSYELRELLMNEFNSEGGNNNYNNFYIKNNSVLKNGTEMESLECKKDDIIKKEEIRYGKIFTIFQNFIKKYYYKQWIFYEHVRKICDFTEVNEFIKKRKTTRKLYLYVGPTNSGKTYEAFTKLIQSKNGLYCAPLRLLAWEIHKKLIKLNKVVNLLTGQEIAKKKDNSHTVCTIEMTPLNKNYDCAIIDEIQMINDSIRGYAWTNVLINLKCEKIYLCGSEYIVHLIKNLSDILNDQLIIKRFNRLTKLELQEHTENLENLKTGDCIITFSRSNIMLLKKKCEQLKKRVFIIYGSLPPETKKKQIELFNNYCNLGKEDKEVGNSSMDTRITTLNGRNKDMLNEKDYSDKETILIATDVIGMGLNISIKRILFYSLKKYDGDNLRYLSISEILQISGRAGRYDEKCTEKIVGYITCVHLEDLNMLRNIFKNRNLCHLTGNEQVERRKNISTVDRTEFSNEINEDFSQPYKYIYNGTCTYLSSVLNIVCRQNNHELCTSSVTSVSNGRMKHDAPAKVRIESNTNDDNRDYAANNYDNVANNYDGDTNYDGRSFLHKNERSVPLRAGYFPDFGTIENLGRILEYEHKANIQLHEILEILVDYLKLNDYFFLTKNYNQMIFIAKFLKHINMEKRILFIYTLAPININNVIILNVMKTFSMCHSILGYVDFFECVDRDVLPTLSEEQNFKSETNHYDEDMMGKVPLLVGNDTIVNNSTVLVDTDSENVNINQISIECIRSKRISSERVSSERIISKRISSEHVISEHIYNDHIKNEQINNCNNPHNNLPAFGVRFPLNTPSKDGQPLSSCSSGDNYYTNIGFDEYTKVLEVYYEIIDLFCWLHTKFPNIYKNINLVNDEKNKVSTEIIHMLTKC
ncbi:ATP-dependent RNA helicase SUV3 [Plasmodium brasilianum]|uniref:ATP-dependent DEAD box helicase, putative n=2 Tax=Plasmodium (Plasmodium) TaxID=418103 RepID=A0A1A8W613_PLAMA|nr:ATP-dependent RNA helicase SUV3, putative [Plasmodium malariae]KAI4837266.1 ATP-dependent RNA helicase SUV3 [Plasmodium brasilianum]SBS87114.1 ATP-dependent DEAD box helicase, putative [Plasmodium malariae]SCO93148.1 ATP-dependent RNA helicase SUV3, putative [Plasmodium malariae]